MSIDLATLPDDVETLHRMIGDLVRERDSARAEAEAEIARLRRMLKTLQRMQFGRRSERLDPDQLQLGLEDVATDLVEVEEGAVRDPGNQDVPSYDRTCQRLSLSDHLPREDQMVDVPSDACPCCGGPAPDRGERQRDAGSGAGATPCAAYPASQVWLPRLQDHPSGPGA